MTGLGVTLLNHNDAQKIVRDLSNELFGEVVGKVFSLIKNHLDKAKQLGFLNEKITKKFIFGDQLLRRFLYDTLENFPEFTYVSVSYDTGKMLGSDYLSKELKVRQWVQLGNKTSEVTEYRKDKKSGELTIVSVKKDTYDPRVRPWYIKAKKLGHAAWVDPYMWIPEKIPGITFIIPSKNEKNQMDRVLTVDIRLDFISDALKNYYQYQSGVVFIVNEKGFLIAHNKINLSGFTKDGDSSLPHVKETKDEQTQLAFNEWSKEIENESLEYFFKGDKYLLRTKHLNISEDISWYILMSVSEKENLVKAFGSLYRSLGFSLTILIVIIIFSLIISQYLSRNFGRIFLEMKSIFQFSFEKTPHIHSLIYEIDKISTYLANIKSSLASFKKYLSPVLVKKYLLDGMEAKLGGEEKEVTVMFIDIENYTSISEQSSEKDLINLLNKFSMIITKNVDKFHGTVDKFIGDSIMNFWGGVDDLERHALLACQCALSCYEDIQKSDMNINIRIGINTGKVVIGNFGSEERFNFTVLGDNVNQASRLESSNKIYKTNILISEMTFSKVQDVIMARKIDDVILKGKHDAITIYEISNSKDKREKEVRSIYEQALVEYQSRNWQKAIQYLEQVLHIKDNDGPSLLLKERCQRYQKEPPAKDWNGVFRIEVK